MIKQYQLENLDFIEVSNDSHLRVVFSTLGASIFNIYFYDECMTRNVLDVNDFNNSGCYYGKTIGRTSNRIKGNVIEINRKFYKLENNEGKNVLHGGKSSFSNKVFKAEIKECKDFIKIEFTYCSRDLESGYPGNADIKVTYKVYKLIDTLEVKYEGISDKTTLLSMTNHTYFSLGDSDLSKLSLQIHSTRYLEVNKDDLLPKEIKPTDKVMNFSEFKSILKDIDDVSLQGKMMNGYDTFFYFDEVDINKVNVSLKNDKYQLDIKTSFEGLQVYTSNYIPSFKLDNKVMLRDSVALEPSDSFLKLPLLEKGHLYSREIRYIFKSL